MFWFVLEFFFNIFDFVDLFAFFPLFLILAKIFHFSFILFVILVVIFLPNFY